MWLMPFHYLPPIQYEVISLRVKREITVNNEEEKLTHLYWKMFYIYENSL